MRRRTRAGTTATALLASAGLLAGCAPRGVGTPAAPPPRPARAGGPAAAPPGHAAVALPEGSIDAALAQLPGIAEGIRARSGVPGMAVAVVRDGRTVYAQGFGDRIIGHEDLPVDPATVFQVASVSKPIGATVVAHQVSQGVVSWDTPVSKELKGFALADPWVSRHVTVGDLYAHRSGLPPAAGDLLEDVGYDRAYVLHHLRDEPLKPFRASYGYANFGLTAGAEAVAQASGTDWATLSQRELYGPLGMTSTSSRHADFLAQKDRAVLHTLVKGRFEPRYDRDPDEQSPAGGVSTNVLDLGRWMSMVLADGQVDVDGKPFMKASALLPALTPQAVNGPPADPATRTGSYGYGMNVGVQPGGRVTLGHSGAFNLGAGTSFALLPSAGVGIVTLTNGAPVGAAEAVNQEFLDLVQLGQSTRDWYAALSARFADFSAPVGDFAGTTPSADAAPVKRLDRYTGSYRNGYFGKAVVTRDGRDLVVALGPKGGYRVTLRHWDGDTFAFTPTGENAPYGSLSSARFGFKAGKARSLELQYFAADGHGRWTR